jgi:oxygen-independent coproporphyrinogen-3 oxidase
VCASASQFTSSNTVPRLAEEWRRKLPQAAYVHVPFCLHRCGYCDFTVIAGREDLIPAYLRALRHELKSKLTEPAPMQTVFIGGGTPSLLRPDDLKELLALLREWLPLRPGGELSIECNPEQFSVERMDVLRGAGVNRISLGVQSFRASELQTLERSHAPETVWQVVEQLRSRQLTNISLDLIFAVPGQSLSDWKNNLAAAVELSPQHVSTYGLTYEKGTRFWSLRQKQSLQPAPDETERQMYEAAMTLLPDHGYQQYELSNFARPGFESRHNQVYWRAEPYYGFGPGAAEFRNGIRSVNHRSVTTWLKRLQAGEPAVMEAETMSDDLLAREAVMLGLRQTQGLDCQSFQDRFGCDPRALAPDAYDQLVQSGLISEEDKQLKLTLEGRFLADSVMAEFF